ncbi:MAG: polyphosphate:AMP phosphotransferase [Proteobacteria bacterium]|nr:polyphosphate:AMP phosphotransferase [Pseudomonadota bacterium]
MSPAKASPAAKIFKSAEKAEPLSDGDFRKLKDDLRLDLIELQQEIRNKARFPVIVVLAGVKGAGVIDTLNVINTWMDPRWVETHAFDAPSDEESERPPFWRYWRSLPAAGAMGLYLEGWYGELLGLDPKRPVGRGDDRLRHIATFEQTLADDGALILKFWLHLSERHHRKSQKDDGDDPIFGLRPADHAWRPQPPYSVYVKTAANVIAKTNTGRAPWHIVGGRDANRRRFEILDILRKSFTAHLKRMARTPKRGHAAVPRKVPAHDILAAVDLSQSMSDKDYARAFHEQQARLYRAQQAARQAGISTVLAFEGWDAAGKGGAIRRLAYGLSAYNYKVVPIAAPSDEERKHHYLWRFWRALDRAGHITIFDRSWYGRVLVERVDNLIPKSAWQRAYDEINTFEEEMTASGIVLLKFWLHIDKNEQLKRFKERRKDPAKQWKLTADDFHNRKNWNAYAAAVNEMVKRTSRDAAPWRIIAANSKNFARVTIMDTVATALEKALAGRKKGR